ncbi:anti-sigma factor family protein [Mariniradius sediminis]|uniref:Tetratricopeptide repeat-containing protein n=1 Tax=Mariniradius sediminis TaxID=2909237 RepID=A0ABS9BX09_9BACT|nr:hypothetical protein [Mariniradius sediminis]MCF1752538.1 hypothetical protein [Mariniradius sediminis]
MDNDLQMLEDYLDGTLSKADAESVNEKLKKDPELREMLALLQASTQGIKLAGRRTSIRKIHEEFILETRSNKKMEPATTRKIFPWWMGVAASLTLVLAFTAISIFRFPGSFLEESAIKYELPTMRSAGTNIDDLETAFKNKNWSVLLEKVDIQETDRKALFLASMAALQKQEFELGLQYLDALESQNNVQTEPLFKNEISYYRLVFHLELRDYNSALDAWKTLDAEKDNPYRTSLGLMDKASLWILGQF